ncbi:hypothetical protein L1987_82112 [Smallanthus sonchifolius]|uniref:Uncharacterized protein n=1 Tax=Smallanthus sonchifolius TaxID=185202 RepID=A0ACB8YSD7_9ASTR|nr:hypothetical protein L1987_82112 [Smallanthus sonchifolius]
MALLRLTSFILLLSFSNADDAIVMSKLSTSISPTPSTWKTNNFCEWEGIKYQNPRSSTQLIRPHFFGNLQTLRLSYNDLTGSLPAAFGGSKIVNLWLNNQNKGLSGTLHVISSMTQLSQVWLHANAFTGAILDLSNCINIFDLQLRDNQFTVFLFLLGSCPMRVSYRVPSKLDSRDHNEIPISENGNLMISVQVLDQATNHFSDNNVLGRGGFGVVYKGELHDGTMIAVKRMKSDATGTKGIKEFQAEVGALTKVRHRHLVALLDVGRGVEYLHSLAQQRFIHRDLKSANILLDNDMRAKVADFGFVKIVLDGKYSVETRLAGTFGYLPPEYAGTGRVTAKMDVYAFGVVLMELVTGRKALDETMSDEICHLATWFRRVPVSKENMANCIDQLLDIDDEATLESIFKVAELAGHCTAHDPFHRPNMGYVVNVLGPLVEQWEPAQQEEEQTYHRLHRSLPHVLQANEDTSTTLFDVFQPNSV